MNENTVEMAILGECLESVVDYRGKTPSKSPCGIPTITAANVKSGRIDMSTVSYVSEKTYWEWSTRGFPEASDVLITTEAPVGEVAPFPGDQTYLITRRVFAMRGKKGVLDNAYLLYTCLSSIVQDELQSRIRGSTVPRVLKTDILDLRIPLPSIDEQKAIAHILGTLDDKIELNRKTNETLEATAKALFKSWFVDFDPVRAKAEGRPTGLPAEISDLFPDSFEDSELGEIPSGWGVQSAGNQYEVSIGKTPPRKESQWFSTSTVDMPWLSIRDLGETGVYADRTSECLTRAAVEKFNVRVVPVDTVVLSFKLTIGRVAITASEMLTNEAIAHFSPFRKGVGSQYTYCLLSQYDYHSLGSTSSIATAVNSQILRDMPLVVPPETIARSFCDATLSIFSSIKCSQRETHCLSDFRDALLPKLISGEIRIPDAEKMLKEVGV